MTFNIEYIYHGSFYKTNILRPGIYYTKDEIEWDRYESNRFLYATRDKNFAIQMGYASALSQLGINVDEFIVDGNEIKIKADSLINRNTVEKIYLYKLPLTTEWTKNNNPFNNANTEFKTTKEIKKISKVYEIDVKKWLMNYVLINKE